MRSSWPRSARTTISGMTRSGLWAGPYAIGERVHRAAIGEAALVQRDPVAEVEESERVHRRHRAGECVHVGTVGHESSGEMRADEPGGAGYEDARTVEVAHGPRPSTQSLLSSSASL